MKPDDLFHAAGEARQPVARCALRTPLARSLAERPTGDSR